ncbi:MULTISPECIES: FAD-dependent oxidoreductase [unclassified Mesorhizobium]|uniref:FAD-dependent oxidoreductase n=1 Tax=unclassified Mesorhizobium TaxID=325217 RepID=UPI0032AEA654
MQESLDIAIAGAGPAGLATALYLNRSGHHVTVFERFDEPKPVGSGLILQPTGLSVLAELGLLDDILSLGSRIDRLHGADAGSGRTVLDIRYDAQRGGRFGLAVHRAALFGVLFRAAWREAIAIETNVEIEARKHGGLITLPDDLRQTRSLGAQEGLEALRIILVDRFLHRPPFAQRLAPFRDHRLSIEDAEIADPVEDVEIAEDRPVDGVDQ